MERNERKIRKRFMFFFDILFKIKWIYLDNSLEEINFFFFWERKIKKSQREMFYFDEKKTFFHSKVTQFYFDP